MTYKAIKLAMTLAACAVLLAGCEQPSKTVAVDFTVDVSGVARPAGSGVAIVGNASSIGATVDLPEGDLVRGLKLHLRPDGKYFGSAWLPSDQDVKYTVYMTDPYAPMIDMPGGPPVENHVDFANPTGTGESVIVEFFDVPQNIVKPCVDFSVTVPANTPSTDPVYIAGDDDQLGPWLPGKQALTNDGGGSYSVHLCFNQGQALKYKYVRSNGDWSKVEKNADGSERADRLLTITEDVSRADTVEKWADL